MKEFNQVKNFIITDHINKTKKIEKIQKIINENGRHLRKLTTKIDETLNFFKTILK